jgi:creatinine amidohydrolase
MHLSSLHWQQLESYLQHGGDRLVIPLGCTEQHAFLSLATDSILAERIALEAAAPLGIPVMPVMPYGITPLFAAYPGSPSLRVETFNAVVRDLLDSMYAQGFRRFLIVNGHGGNTPAEPVVAEWTAAHAAAGNRPQTIFHNWWRAPKTWAAVQSIDPVASHASWMENFPWTRLEGVAMPGTQKPMTDLARLREMSPAQARQTLGDGNFGGRYQRSDEDMHKLWAAAVAETRELLEHGWR